MSKQQVLVPDIGGSEDAEVIELLVTVGDEVALEQGLIVLESDKASMEIPTTVAGTVVEVLVAEGDQLAEGAPVVTIELVGETAEEAVNTVAAAPAPDLQSAIPEAAEIQTEMPAQQSDSSAATTTAANLAAVPASVSGPVVEAAANSGKSGNIYAGPAVRKLAREFGVTLQQVTGSGPRGRILKEDLQQHVQKALQGSTAALSATGGTGIPPVPEVDFSRFGEVEITTRSKLDKLTAANMHRSWLNVPHVTQFDEADITELEEFRAGLKVEAERRGARITPLPFLLKACAVALRDNPRINSSLGADGENLVFKKYIHIGMAVDTPAGLMVPVIRDVDKKNIWELAADVADMAARARDRKLAPADMQGGSFTISSLGSIGGNGFTPIVNTPEVGILGVSNAAIKPVWDGQAFAPRKMLPLALSYDHRVVNGGDGGRFLSRLVALLGDIRQLSM